jgi:hypothetical protein
LSFGTLPLALDIVLKWAMTNKVNGCSNENGVTLKSAPVKKLIGLCRLRRGSAAGVSPDGAQLSASSIGLCPINIQRYQSAYCFWPPEPECSRIELQFLGISRCNLSWNSPYRISRVAHACSVAANVEGGCFAEDMQIGHSVRGTKRPSTKVVPRRRMEEL